MTPAPAATAAATTKVARAAPVVTKAAPPAAKMSLQLPPPLQRAGTVTPPETRSPTGRGRPEASLPTWPPGVLVAVNATVPKVSSSDDEASPRAASEDPPVLSASQCQGSQRVDPQPRATRSAVLLDACAAKAPDT